LFFSFIKREAAPESFVFEAKLAGSLPKCFELKSVPRLCHQIPCFLFFFLSGNIKIEMNVQSLPSPPSAARSLADLGGPRCKVAPAAFRQGF
jgi:hypothetical protein